MNKIFLNSLFRKTILVIIFFAPYHVTYAQDTTPSNIVNNIQIIGNYHISNRAFIKLLPFAVGDSFDSQKVTESIELIYEYAFFENIKVSYKTNTEGNMDILYEVIEKPWVKSITIKGNDDLSSTTIKNKISNSASKFYNAFNNSKDIEMLLKIYLATGFIGTQIDITANIVDKKTNEIDLFINIYEGEKLSIKSINIYGNNILSPNFLKDSFETLREPSVLGLIKKSFIPELLPNEEKRMIAAAEQKGFLDFQILKREITLSISSYSVIERIEKLLRRYTNKSNLKRYTGIIQDIFIDATKTRIEPLIDELKEDLKKTPNYEKKKERIQLELESLKIQANSLLNAREILRRSIPESIPLRIVTTSEKESYYNLSFAVKEGKQYLFNNIEILGSDKIDIDFLKKNFLILSPGEIYNSQAIQQFKSAVEQYYRDRGYFGIIIQDTPNKNETLYTIGHRIVIQEGEKMHIERMYIKNNEKTKPHVIDRELRIKEGSIFNQSDIILSQRLLQRTGYFQNINIIPSPGSEENLIDLTWVLQEQKTGSFRFGGGYGTETGFSVYGSIAETNFLGEGINTSVNAQWGQYQRSLQVAISSQYIGYTPVGWSFSTGYSWYRENASPRYDRDKDGRWDKIILKDGKYYFIQQGDPDFYEYYDENRTGSFTPEPGTGSGDPISFAPGTHDDIYAESRYFERQLIYLELGGGYSFADFWTFHAANGVSFSRYNNPRNIEVGNIYEDPYYTLKADLLSGRFIYSSYMRFSLYYNSTNSPMTPTQGIKTGLTTDLYGIEGGSNQFVRLTYLLNIHVPIISSKKYDFDFVWATGVNIAGNVSFFGKEFKIHYENLLSFNTMEEIRGWSQYIGNAEFVGLGKISFGTELRASIPYTSKMLWLVGFFDGGNISENPSSLPSDFTRYFYSTGIGVRIDFSSFPLRFYLAQRLKWDKNKKFFTTIGGITFEFAITSSF